MVTRTLLLLLALASGAAPLVYQIVWMRRALEVAASASQLAPGNPRARDLVERARGATRTGR